jgi:hypothetical protein
MAGNAALGAGGAFAVWGNVSLTVRARHPLLLHSRVHGRVAWTSPRGLYVHT